jgi:hypothetical protein
VEKPGNQAVTVNRIGEHAEPPDNPEKSLPIDSPSKAGAYLSANPGGDAYLVVSAPARHSGECRNPEKTTA